MIFAWDYWFLLILELVDRFTYIGSNISSTENDVNIQLAKAWAAIDRLSIMWKSDISNKIKDFLQVVAVSILLYGQATWTLTKCTEKKRKMKNQAILNKFWKQHPTKQKLYSQFHWKNHRIRRTRHEGHSWRCKDKLWWRSSMDPCTWAATHGHASVGRPAKTYLHQLCANTRCRLEDPPGVMDDRDGWRERERE